MVAENARAGTDAWKITTQNRLGEIEGYAASTSVPLGGQVDLAVSTTASTYAAEVSRRGFYGGKRARLVLRSPTLRGVHQLVPTIDLGTGLMQAHWSPTFTLAVGTDWLPGDYLIKLVSATGDQSYVPLTVRDDRVHADVLVLNAVTTWQAYNPWGGCSLYRCKNVNGRTRAVKVSFDRPYAHDWNMGSADFLDHELPLVALVEELGIDTAYATSVDLHEQPAIASATKAVLSLGHDEYCSAVMRQAVVDARENGVNLAFFGADAIYRHIRFEPDAAGTPDRVVVNYRNLFDPLRKSHTDDTTVEWRQSGQPEAALVGIQYLCAHVSASLVVAASDHGIWAGAHVHNGEALRRLVGNEADGTTGASPPNLDLLAKSPVVCGVGHDVARMSYYHARSGAGVFASGTIWWICALDAAHCSVPANIAAVRAVTVNVLRAFAQGPAGRAHPSGPKA